MDRMLRRTLGASLTLAAVAGARPALAQWGRIGNVPQNAQMLFEWQGRVDRETEIDVGRTRPTARGVSQRENRGRFGSFGANPRGNGSLYVVRVSGRGQVDLVQQLSNGRDGVIRVRDPQGGDDTYRIRVYWQSSGTVYGQGRDNGRSGGNRSEGTYGEGVNGDEDDRYDRAEDRRDRAEDRRDRNDDRRSDDTYGRGNNNGTNGNNGRGRAVGRRP